MVSNSVYDVICGVPYTALPIATVMSVDKSIPMVMRRKEVKDYGTGKAIEGAFKAGQTCLLIEDLVTSGMSVFETIKPLNEVGLIVKDVIVLVDRQQGGKQNIESKGVNLHAVITINSLLEILEQEGRLEKKLVDKVKEFIAQNQVNSETASSTTASKVIESKESIAPIPAALSVSKLSYSERIQYCKNACGKNLLSLMDRKKTNLCVSLDCTDVNEFFSIADAVGPHICMLKTHVDIIENFDAQFVEQLIKLAQKHEFLVFEDRKYADIGNTVALQYSKGIYKVSEWADVVNAHTVPGPGIIAGLKQAGLQKGRGLLLLAEMSSEGSLATHEYTQKTVKMAEANTDFVFGFISQSKLSNDPGLLYLTPGVDLSSKGDNLGQQYNTPEYVILTKQCDVIIVGRGIYKSENPSASALLFKQAGWNAYEQRIKP
jgi:uridine monophosphate synthetase